jgi:hypothetical protein
MKKIVIPARYIRREKIGKTRFLQSKHTGLMKGRRGLKHGEGDGTHTRRIKTNVDIDGDKKPDYLKGQIVGRTQAIRGSSGRRGYVRRTVD